MVDVGHCWPVTLGLVALPPAPTPTTPPVLSLSRLCPHPWTRLDAGSTLLFHTSCVPSPHPAKWPTRASSQVSASFPGFLWRPIPLLYPALLHALPRPSLLSSWARDLFNQLPPALPRSSLCFIPRRRRHTHTARSMACARGHDGIKTTGQSSSQAGTSGSSA